jgi:hypothetical protein
VKQRAWSEVSVGDRHVQGFDDQAGAHVRCQLPPDDHPCSQVDHGREIQPPFTGFEVGDVADQPLPRRMRGELAADQI